MNAVRFACHYKLANLFDLSKLLCCMNETQFFALGIALDISLLRYNWSTIYIIIGLLSLTCKWETVSLTLMHIAFFQTILRQASSSVRHFFSVVWSICLYSFQLIKTESARLNVFIKDCKLPIFLLVMYRYTCIRCVTENTNSVIVVSSTRF